MKLAIDTVRSLSPYYIWWPGFFEWPNLAAGSAVICQLLHLPLPKTKKNLPFWQAVKRKMKIIRTKGLEVCI